MSWSNILILFIEGKKEKQKIFEKHDNHERVPVAAHAEVEDGVEVEGVEKVEHLSKMKDGWTNVVVKEEVLLLLLLRKQFLDLRHFCFCVPSKNDEKH